MATEQLVKRYAVKVVVVFGHVLGLGLLAVSCRVLSLRLPKAPPDEQHE